MIFTRKAIGVVVIVDDRLLLVRKRQSWILPGGKPEEGKTDIDCLKREISEEIIGFQASNFRYYGSFVGKTPHKGDELEAIVYLADSISSQELSPGGEIEEIIWLGAFMTEFYPVSDITRRVVKSLVQTGHLKKGRRLVL